MADVGIVTIGRNEGERLRRCLASVGREGIPTVYVDSASSDHSVEIARAAGVDVVELSASRALSAARARNEGLERLLSVVPGLRFVQFVDGDCELVEGWIAVARRELAAHADVAVVCGRRRERSPVASIYNRAAETEWNTPIGEVSSCGGDALMRIDDLRAVGGFDSSLAAGEEPELCQRLRQRGSRIVRLDAEMSVHDSGLLRFAQWWSRSVRSGYGAMDVATRFGSAGLFVRQVRSARLWTGGWLALVIGAALLGSLATSSARAAMALAALAALLLPLQMMRVALGVRRRSTDGRSAAAYGFLTMLGKWPQLLGQLLYLRDHAAGRSPRLIEYKS